MFDQFVIYQSLLVISIMQRAYPYTDQAKPWRIMEFTCDIKLIMYRFEVLELTKVVMKTHVGFLMQITKS